MFVVCSLPKQPGTCKASIPRYYYDYKEKRCGKFIYGGCGGNENNFETLEDCQERCPEKPDSMLIQNKIIDIFVIVVMPFCRFRNGKRRRRGHERMVVGFMTTYAISAYRHSRCEFEPCSWRVILDTTLCDKAC